MATWYVLIGHGYSGRSTFCSLQPANPLLPLPYQGTRYWYLVPGIRLPGMYVPAQIARAGHTAAYVRYRVETASRLN